MQAMIFAAGLGTRLRPITNTLPKALVPVGGIPLLEIAIRRLKYFGIQHIVINVHHFADLIEKFLKEKQFFGLNISISDERALLLETGGGLKKARHLFEQGPILVVNADILCSIDYQQFFDYHQTRGGIATLAVRQRKSSRYLLFDEEYTLSGWENIKTGEQRIVRHGEPPLHQFGFSGIHVIEPELFDFMPADQAKFSIIDVYLKAAAEAEIKGYLHDADIWLDVGKPEQLAKAGAVLDEVMKGI